MNYSANSISALCSLLSISMNNIKCTNPNIKATQAYKKYMLIYIKLIGTWVLALKV